MSKKQVYSNLKIFHYPEKLKSLKEKHPALPPLQIRIKPINACNHNCSYCCYRSGLQLGKDMNEKDMIPREKMLELIDDIIEMQVKSVTFSGGGEPLTYPYMVDVLKKLASSPVKFATLTNGVNLAGEIAEIFAAHGSWIRVSIDGWDNESYAKYRGIKLNDFDKVIKNLRLFTQMNGACKAGAVIVIDEKNVNHLYELTMKLRDCGIDTLKMAPCIINNDWKKNDAYHENFFDKATEEINRAISDLSTNSFSIKNTYHLLGGKFKKDYEWCPRLQICPVIGADCNVYSCQDKAYNISDGLLFTIKNVRFKDAWLSDKNQFYRISPAQDCQHHCVANEANKMIMEYFNLDHTEFV